MKKYKFSLKSYAAPTPKFWRKVGDGLLASGGAIAMGGTWQFDNLTAIFTHTELKIIISCSILMAVVGKFLTNFFKANDTPTQSTEDATISKD